MKVDPDKDKREVEDPVCKMQIDRQTAVENLEYYGKQYYFCSTYCRLKFEQNPEEFV